MALYHCCRCQRVHTGDQEKQRQYLARLMGPPNTTWGQILAQAQANPEVLKQQEVIKSLQNVLQTNVSVCTSLGNPYISQMAQMVDSMLQVWLGGRGAGAEHRPWGEGRPTSTRRHFGIPHAACMYMHVHAFALLRTLLLLGQVRACVVAARLAVHTRGCPCCPAAAAVVLAVHRCTGCTVRASPRPLSRAAPTRHAAASSSTCAGACGQRSRCALYACHLRWHAARHVWRTGGHTAAAASHPVHVSDSWSVWLCAAVPQWHH